MLEWTLTRDSKYYIDFCFFEEWTVKPPSEWCIYVIIHCLPSQNMGRIICYCQCCVGETLGPRPGNNPNINQYQALPHTSSSNMPAGYCNNPNGRNQHQACGAVLSLFIIPHENSCPITIVLASNETLQKALREYLHHGISNLKVIQQYLLKDHGITMRYFILFFKFLHHYGL